MVLLTVEDVPPWSLGWFHGDPISLSNVGVKLRGRIRVFLPECSERRRLGHSFFIYTNKATVSVSVCHTFRPSVRLSVTFRPSVRLSVTFHLSVRLSVTFRLSEYLIQTNTNLL